MQQLKYNNIVIENLDESYGKRIKAFFETNGVDTEGYNFVNGKPHHDRFYGIINDRFCCCTQKEVYEAYATIIKLPEPEPLKLTLEEIAEKLGVNKVEIVED